MKDFFVNKIRSLFCINGLLYIVASVAILFLFIVHVNNAFNYKTSNGDSNTALGLESGVEYSQKIECNQDVLKKFYLVFGTCDRKNTGKIIVSIKDDSEKVFQSWELDTSTLIDNNAVEFELEEPVLLSSIGDFYISIKNIYEDDNQVAVYSATGGGHIYVDSYEVEGMTINYGLTLEKTAEKETWMPVYIGVIIILVLVGILFFDISKLQPKYILVTFIIIFLSIKVLNYSIFQEFNTKFNIIQYSSSEGCDVVNIGEGKEYKISVKQSSFDEVSFLINEPLYSNLGVIVKGTDTDIVYYEALIQESSITYRSKSEKYAVSIKFNTSLPKGDYQIFITNHGEYPISIDKNSKGLNVSVNKSSFLAHKITIFVIVLISLMMIFVLGYAIHNYDIEKIYLALVIPLGLIYFTIFLPWTTPDASPHFLATYRHSNILLGFDESMEWYGRQEDVDYRRNVWGADINPSLEGYANVYHDLNLKCEASEMVQFPVIYENMECYSVFNYLPQVVGFTLARIMNLSTDIMLLLARFLLLIVYILTTYYAIKTTPIGKGVFALVSLLPMSLSVSSSLSYDGMVLISTMCFTANVFNLFKNYDSKKAIIHTAVWAFILGSVKGGGYLILLPLAFVLFRKEDKKKSIMTIMYVVCAGLGAVLLFNVIIPAGAGMFQLGVEGNGKLTASYALEHPLKFIDMAMAAYIEYFDFLAIGSSGTHLSWGEFTIPVSIVMLLMVLICLYSACEEDSVELPKKGKNVFLAIILVGLVATPAMLLSWNNIGAKVIEGLQGRYYLPLLPVFVFVMTKFYKRELWEKSQNIMLKNKFLIWYVIISSVAVFYVLRLYITR
ncbi:MAG: DUF2142 domain-containing protein [Lachnospiraceae bacterium]|nr:DUF2142 domain-containing protein [Lachnospiraceae bacterium]